MSTSWPQSISSCCPSTSRSMDRRWRWRWHLKGSRRGPFRTTTTKHIWSLKINIDWSFWLFKHCVVDNITCESILLYGIERTPIIDLFRFDAEPIEDVLRWWWWWELEAVWGLTPPFLLWLVVDLRLGTPPLTKLFRDAREANDIASSLSRSSPRL